LRIEPAPGAAEKMAVTNGQLALDMTCRGPCPYLNHIRENEVGPDRNRIAKQRDGSTTCVRVRPLHMVKVPHRACQLIPSCALLIELGSGD
jgi:hypothetical protein